MQATIVHDNLARHAYLSDSGAHHTVATQDARGGIYLDWKLFIGGVLMLFIAGMGSGGLLIQHLPWPTNDQVKLVAQDLQGQVNAQAATIIEVKQQLSADESNWLGLNQKVDDLRVDLKSGQAAIMQRLADQDARRKP